MPLRNHSRSAQFGPDASLPDFADFEELAALAFISSRFFLMVKQIPSRGRALKFFLNGFSIELPRSSSPVKMYANLGKNHVVIT